MKLSENQIIFSLNVADLIHFANNRSIGLTFGEGYRTKDQQKLYYYGYTLKVKNSVLDLIKGRVKSKTLNSKHLKRLAVDFNFFICGKLTYDKETLQCLGDFWESLHPKNRWGGNFKNFKDVPHFEMNI